MTACATFACTSYLGDTFFRLLVRLLVVYKGVVLATVGVKRVRRNVWLASFGTKKGVNGHTRVATECLYIRTKYLRESAFS